MLGDMLTTALRDLSCPTTAHRTAPSHAPVIRVFTPGDPGEPSRQFACRPVLPKELTPMEKVYRSKFNCLSTCQDHLGHLFTIAHTHPFWSDACLTPCLCCSITTALNINEYAEKSCQGLVPRKKVFKERNFSLLAHNFRSDFMFTKVNLLSTAADLPLLCKVRLGHRVYWGQGEILVRQEGGLIVSLGEMEALPVNALLTTHYITWPDDASDPWREVGARAVPPVSHLYRKDLST